MKIIDLNKKDYESLKDYILAFNTLNTESELYFYRGDVLKRLYPEFFNTFNNKLYTLDQLDKNFDKIVEVEELQIPNTLVTYNTEVFGFLLDYIKSETLNTILESPYHHFGEKKELLYKVGNLLKKMDNLRNKHESLKDFYIGDLHGDNILVDENNNIKVVDLDSCKIANNKASAAYLLPVFNPRFINLKEKYPSDNNGYLPNKNTDLYCYTTILLNYLFQGKASALTEKMFDKYIDYLELIGVGDNLIKCFRTLYTDSDNINPCDYLDEIPHTFNQASKELFREFELVKMKENIHIK